MDIKILVLFCMIFCHIIDDYYLQGILASMKQKSWWQENAPDEKYKNDYVMALHMHAFSWAFMISIPVIVYWICNDVNLLPVFFVVAFNCAIHAIIDDLKANQKKINLIEDQLVHVSQIILTWFLLVV